MLPESDLDKTNAKYSNPPKRQAKSGIKLEQHNNTFHGKKYPEFTLDDKNNM